MFFSFKTNFSHFFKSVGDVQLGHKEVTVEIFISAIQYLMIISFVYMEKSHQSFDENNRDDYKKLVPIIGKSKLAVHFSEMYGLSNEIANNVIDRFIFNDSNDQDLFCQPLVFAGGDCYIILILLFKA